MRPQSVVVSLYEIMANEMSLKSSNLVRPGHRCALVETEIANICRIVRYPMLTECMSVPGRTHGCSALASSSERRSFFLVSFRDGTDCYCDWSVATYGTPMRTQHIYESLHSDFVMNKTCTTNRGIFRCHLAQHAFAMLCSNLVWFIFSPQAGQGEFKPVDQAMVPPAPNPFQMSSVIMHFGDGDRLR